MQTQESPIFYDNSGKRWKNIIRALLVFFTMLAGASIWVLPQIAAPVQVTGFHDQPIASAAVREPAPTPEAITYSFPNWATIPIIGEGPLVRVVRVAHRLDGEVAEDPFTGRVYRNLTQEELVQIGGNQYSIERYGATHGKRIALTFDDGPDPRYSPGILDILAREHVPSTFFVMGSNMVRYPALAQRLIQEGHIVGNHTFSHADIDLVGPTRAYEEINATARVISDVVGQYSLYFRPPYIGHDDRSTRGGILSILRAQQMGYVVTGFTIDTQDWQFSRGLEPTLPPLSGADEVILLHDSGGDRSRTLEYIERFIGYARSQGYTFVTLNELYPLNPPLTGRAETSFADQATSLMTKIFFIAPQKLLSYLFYVTAGITLVTSTGFITLATIYMRQTKNVGKIPFKPFVSVLVPAYNEGRVISTTIQSLLLSRYPDYEIVVIDDGSTDDTREVARSFISTGRVRVISKENGGKASALNAGHAASLGDILVTLDGDTIFTPDTIGQLVRHFADPKVGAVAGVIKVGNRTNLLTLWQALEYVSGIAIDRQAQGLMSAIAIVPGACSAWLKSAIEAAGGHSAATLAEDCDLTLGIQKAGYRVVQDLQAVAYTEAPQTLRALMKQRFRWTFGNMQALWKHRDMIGRRKYGLLGLFIMPFFVFTIAVPLLFTPFTYLQLMVSLFNGDWMTAALYFGIFTAVHFVIALVAILFMREKLSLLLLVPFYRLIYDPIRLYVLYASFVAALKGKRNGWGKLHRTGTVTLDPAKQPANLAAAA